MPWHLYCAFGLFACTKSSCQYRFGGFVLGLRLWLWASIFLVSILWGTGFLGRLCFMSKVSDTSCNSSMSLRHGAETGADSAFQHHCKYAKSIFFFCKPYFKILTSGNDSQHGWLQLDVFQNFINLLPVSQHTEQHCLLTLTSEYFNDFIDKSLIYLFPIAPLHILIRPISVLVKAQQDVVSIFL